MRIALFSRYPGDSERPKGGIESVTVVLAHALAQITDVDVHVVALEPRMPKVTVQRDRSVTVHRLPGSRWPQILDILVGPGRKRLIGYIRELNPDILHTHETYGLALGSISIPHVFTLHGFDHANLVADSARFAWMRSLLWRMVERRSIAAQKHIISITPYVRTMIEPLTRASIYDIDNPVDERFFEATGHTQLGRILCVGWVNARKNTLGSVEAFAQIAGRYPQARLVIGGEAKEAEYLERVRKSIERHGISEKVDMLGHVNHAQLMEELGKASVFLLPSRQENSPMAIAEAMAAGIPVIASNRCGMPYMVREGQTGLLIDPESTEQIAECMHQLLASPETARQMGQAGRRLAFERFHPRAVAEKTVDVYKRILATT